MKTKLPIVLLTVACAVLAAGLFSAKQEVSRLRQKIAELELSSGGSIAETEHPADPLAAAANKQPDGALPQETEAAPDATSSGRRMMKGMAQMMENPTMNKVMEASQRGAVGALYSDLIEYLDLTAEETEYFMDLLMYRQMKQVDLGMKMMSGGMSEEEKQQMGEVLEEAGEKVKTEMAAFLNDPADYDEFQFYEKTMGERMMLSQMDQSLTGSDAALSDEQYRELLGMMSDEKANYDFNSDLHDENNMDLSAERFSADNLQSFADDMDELNRLIVERAQSMLTPDQLKALEEAIKATADMQKAQLEMAAQMFGGGEEPATP